MSGDLIAALQEKLSGLAEKPLAPVDVAILDSGIDATHPDLAGRVVEAFHFRPEGDSVARTEVPAGTKAGTLLWYGWPAGEIK